MGGRTRWTVVACTVAVAAALLACKKEKKGGETSGGSTPAKPAAAREEKPSTPSSPTAAAGSLLEGTGAKDAAGKFKDKIGGPVKALEFIVYPTYAKCQAQDPKKAENIDEYELRNGSVGDSIPVKLSGDTDQKTVEKNLFPLDDVALGKIPELTKATIDALKIDDGKVTHVIVRRGLPFSPDIRMRVYVNGTRKSGSVEYDKDGKQIKVYN